MTTRRWMVAIAALASLVACVRAAMRPIPVAESVNVATGEVWWSDGVRARAGQVVRPAETTHLFVGRLVRWSDGSISLRLGNR